MSKTFTPEKIRELAEIVQKQGFLSSIEREINNWLEQNPIEPVVVGLSDGQIGDLSIILEGFAYSRENVTDLITRFLAKTG